MSRAGRDAGRRNRSGRTGARPAVEDPRPAARDRTGGARVADLPVVDVPATVFAPRVMLLALLATLVGCTLAGTAVGLWLHSIDNDFGWSHVAVLDVLVCAGTGLLAGLAASVVTAVIAAWTAIAWRRHLARGRLRARLVLLAATLVLWAVGVWLLLAGFGVGAAAWFGWVMMLPALLGAGLVVWCGVPWMLRVLDRP